MCVNTPDTIARRERDVYTVSRLNRTLRELIELTLGTIWVEGEVSNLSKPASGHQYFSLKDTRAQVRCAFFKQRIVRSHVALENGRQVLVRARASLYEPRGDYQLIVESVELAGDGALRQRYEENLRRFEKEGLFAAGRKRPLPTHPTQIGVVTSATGAAVRDVVEVLRRRFALAEVTLYPTAVQGEQAAVSVASAIDLANDHSTVDVLLIVRGGGSLEDLAAFNDEAVVRAMARSKIPTVSGVGHEVDTTLCDLVADWRAPTPSAAAELVSPPLDQLTDRLNNAVSRLQRTLATQCKRAGEQLLRTRNRLMRQHPEQRLNTASQQLDLVWTRMSRAIDMRLWAQGARLGTVDARLRANAPEHLLARKRSDLAIADNRLRNAMARQFERAQSDLFALSRALDNISPLATLERGYAVVRRHSDGAVLQNAHEVTEMDRLRITLQNGELLADPLPNTSDSTPDYTKHGTQESACPTSNP